MSEEVIIIEEPHQKAEECLSSNPEFSIAKVHHAFPLLLNKNLNSACTDAEFTLIFKMIIGSRMQMTIRDLVVVKIEQDLRQDVVPSFWSKFLITKNELKSFHTFKTAVKELHEAVAKYYPTLKRVNKLNNACKNRRTLYGKKDYRIGIIQLLRSTLLSQMPVKNQIIINHFYKISFTAFDMLVNPNISEGGICSGCSHISSDCICTDIISIFYETNKSLVHLQLVERLTGQVLTKFIQSRIETYIRKLCSGPLDVSQLECLEKWLEATVMSWLTRIYCGGASQIKSDDKNHKSIEKAMTAFKQKLTHFCYHTYTNLRIDQLFNIIIEYPDSQPAINDLKICLTKTGLRSSLCKKLQAALEMRLLHPGVNTPEILTAYISTIRTLRHLDPSGVILETVTQPVRNYLRNREDTVRSVVCSLIEDGAGNELVEELEKFTAENEEGKENERAWNDWQPDPVEARPKIGSNDKRDSDIISILVNVYGSKEIFISEYRTLMADRLLAQEIIDADKEIKYLELLKLRFGESQLHFCEVMLKDIADSKRINALVNQDKDFKVDKKFRTNAMVLSAQFWPPFKDESLELPEPVKQHMDAYTKAFESLKGNRTLSWKPHLGSVDIQIIIGKKKIDLTVSPFNATVIMHFQSKPEWSLQDLAQEMKVPITILRRKISYWQSMGIITERIPDFYCLVEKNEVNKSNVSTSQVQEMLCEDDETESAMASAHDQREGELQVFWSYIVGMLTNLDSLPLDRIHQMLKMFASQAPGSECNLQELRQFLDTKVRSHQLVLQGGLYKLPKG